MTISSRPETREFKITPPAESMDGRGGKHSQNRAHPPLPTPDTGQQTRDGHQRVQLSRFARLLDKDGVNCIFHTLNLRMVFGGPILCDIFEVFKKPTTIQQVVDHYSKTPSSQLVRQVIADLSTTSLLVPNANADVTIYRQAYKKAMNQYRIQLMYFLPTSACNLRCKYCFVEDEERHQKACFMDIPTAELALATFARLNREAGHGSVIFYGGEPLLNAKTTFYSLRQLRRL